MNITRFYDESARMDVVQVLPGEFYVTDLEECVTTILGSCVAVCLIDPVTKVGGLNHFLLPGSFTDTSTERHPTNFGDHAMSQLLAEMESYGAITERCDAKLFGGGSMFPNDQAIGQRNIEFAYNYLKKLKISITGNDVGQSYSRRIRFNTRTGKVMVKKLRSLHNKQITKQEVDYSISISGHNNLSSKQLPTGTD